MSQYLAGFWQRKSANEKLILSTGILHVFSESKAHSNWAAAYLLMFSFP